MASVNVILRSRKNANGTQPLAIQIIKRDRKKTVLHLGVNLHEDQWDDKGREIRKSHPNYKGINTLILKRLSEEGSKVISEEIYTGHRTCVELDQLENDPELTPEEETYSSPVIETNEYHASESSFFEQANDYIALLELNKEFNQYSADKPRVERFKKFLGGNDIAFSDITIGPLEKYRGYLRRIRAKQGKYISERTVINHFVVLRSVYAQARKNRVFIHPDHYPFGKGKFKIKFPPSCKIGLNIDLNIDEVHLIEQAHLSDKPLLDHVRNLWLVSFYLAGVRVGDTLLLKWSNIIDGRLYYKMEKNDKDDSIKIPAKALTIIEKYRRPDPIHDLVFPDLSGIKDITDEWEVKKRIKSRVHDLDGRLQLLAELLGINKVLTMHISHHTFGNIAEDKISIQELQKLYRHTHISTTGSQHQRVPGKRPQCFAVTGFLHQVVNALLQEEEIVLVHHLGWPVSAPQAFFS